MHVPLSVRVTESVELDPSILQNPPGSWEDFGRFCRIEVNGKNAWLIAKDAMHEGCELDLVLFLHTTTYKFSLTFLLNHTTSIY